MLGVLFAAVSLPAPSPSPLKTITHVRSSPFCTTLREHVGPAVKALIQNNVAFGNAKSQFLAMAHDKVFRAAPNAVIDMDIQRLGPTIDEIAANLQTSQAQLNAIERASGRSRTQDERELAEMQKELQVIVDRQNAALNILSGTYYSYNGNRLMGHGDGMAKGDGTGQPVDASDDAQHETPIVLPPVGSSSSTPAAIASASPTPLGTPPAIDMGLLGFTKFAALYNSLTKYQFDEQTLEVQAAKTIAQATQSCR